MHVIIRMKGFGGTVSLFGFVMLSILPTRELCHPMLRGGGVNVSRFAGFVHCRFADGDCRFVISM